MARDLYVYAIVWQGLPMHLGGATGFDGMPLSAVPYRALAAVTSPVERGAIASTVEDILRHEATVEAVRREGPALPVRFGTVLANADIVVRALAEQYDLLTADLTRVGDKVEVGLTVLWGEVGVVSDGDAGESLAVPADAPTDAQGAGTRFLLARLATHRHETMLRERARAVARDLDRVLGGYAIEERRVLPVPRMALRAAYLLEPSAVGGFRDRFEAVRAEHPGLRFLLTGPWPPYSFVTREEPGNGAGSGDQLLGLARKLARGTLTG